MTSPTVSIAIPVYNRERSIRRAIETSLGQTYGDLEVVVVDNCSTDGTWEVIRESARRDPRVRVFRNDRNLGPQANWQRSMEACRGRYVKLLFSDDWMEPGTIARLLSPLETRSDVGFAYSGMWFHVHGIPPWTGYQRSTEGLVSTLDLLWAFASLEGEGGWDWNDSSWYDITRRVGADIPITLLPALLRREDAVSTLSLDIPNRLGIDVNRCAIGHDALMFWRCCERYPYVYHVPDPLVHMDEPDRDEPSMARSMGWAGKGMDLALGNKSAFGYYLATSALPARTRRQLHTAMFVGHLPWRFWFHPGQLRTFSRLFPEGYPWWRLQLDGRIARFLVKGARAQIRKTLRHLRGERVETAP